MRNTYKQKKYKALTDSDHQNSTTTMAVSLSRSEIPSSGGASESIRLPSDAKIVDKKITNDDFLLVYDYLAQCSVKWYSIGLYLRVPKEKLDEIEVDYHTTSRRLAQMIHYWINNSVTCTYRELLEAVKKCDRKGTARSVLAEDSETVQIQTDTCTSGDFWERKQISLQEQDGLSNYRYDDYMTKLRAELLVPDDVSEELMLINIELFVPNKFQTTFADFKVFADIIKEILTRLRPNLIHLDEQANLLITDMTMVCDRLQILSTQKDERKEAHITQELEGAYSYQEFLYHGLNNSLDNINKNITRIENLTSAADSIKKHFKNSMLIHFLINGALFPILFIFLISSTWESITVVIFIAVFLLVVLPLIYNVHPNVQRILERVKWMLDILIHIFLQMLYIIVLFAKRKYFLSYAIGGAIQSIIVLLRVLITETTYIPPENQKFLSRVVTAEMMIRIHYSNPALSILMGIILGCLATVVLFSLNYRIRVIALACFVFIVFVSWSILMTHLKHSVMGAVIGVLIQRLLNRDEPIIIVAAHYVGWTLITIIWGTGVIVGLCIGHFSQHAIVDIAATATGGALGGVCVQALIRYTMFPMYNIDCYMEESIQCFNENIHKLKGLKQNIQGLLHRIQSSDDVNIKKQNKKNLDSISVTLED